MSQELTNRRTGRQILYRSKDLIYPTKNFTVWAICEKDLFIEYLIFY